jgi:regulator of RNase E activity RraA
MPENDDHQALLDELRTLDAGTIANAVDRLGLRPKTTGYSSSDVRCLFPELPMTVGYAITCREDTTSPRPGTKVNFEPVYKAVEASPSLPTVIVCQDVGSDRLRSCHLGDIMSTVMRRIGVVAFITDGGVRDIDGISTNAPGFQVFACGLVAGAGECSVIDVGSTVWIGGMEVSPGDLICGDGNGLVSIPPGSLADVVAETRKVRERESELLTFIRSSEFTLEKYFGSRR